LEIDENMIEDDEEENLEYGECKKTYAFYKT
jgi:hypothetical protein